MAEIREPYPPHAEARVFSRQPLELVLARLNNQLRGFLEREGVWLDGEPTKEWLVILYVSRLDLSSSSSGEGKEEELRPPMTSG
jgi:hypothetical protein